ncbi:ABC transporter ATP-binding protein [Sodalis sp. dw_96]|uniref:ABC transporter ATP-binding protein n=1 Tax=Sodalis sp. dw_96 TaxID=2719794 RepID=UPI001BD613E2|nr:ABC transporter ATP-binding protein [Sodalis sp. dw_96]
MNQSKRPAHVLLQSVWKCSTARLASLQIASPRPISLNEPTDRVAPYIWASVKACAPGSTLVIVLATLLGAICNIGQSYFLGQITEVGMLDERRQVVLQLFYLISLWLAAPLLHVVQNLAVLYSSQNLRIGVTDHLSARLMYARPQQLANNTVGNLVERIELVSVSLSEIVCTLADTAIKLIAVAILASLVLTSASWPIALLAAAWMMSAFMLSSYLAYSGMSIAEDASDAHAQVMANLNEIVTNIPLIRSFVAHKTERHRFNHSLRADLLACRKVRSYWLFVLLIETSYKWLFGIGIITYASFQYSTGSLTIPQLVTIGSLIIILSWHFESVAFHFVNLFDSLGILRAGMRELSSIPVDLPSGNKLPTLPEPGKIMLRNVSVGHQGITVLKEISLCIEPGSRVGIVGPSGSGKSTLLAVLRGDLQPDQGTVELHGLPLSTCQSSLFATLCSEALQNALMFNRSVLDNINYGQDPCHTQKIMQTASIAQVNRLINNLPHGLDTIIGERGAVLSTGERQRINIARALLKSCPLLIFDEATSSVDAISEARIIDYLIHRRDSTVLVVSHRIASMRNFDQIVLLDQGRIVDIGRFDELLARNELFQALMQHNENVENIYN